MINQLLQIMALLGVEDYILLFHVVADVVVDVTKRLCDGYVQSFDFLNRLLQLFEIC